MAVDALRLWVPDRPNYRAEGLCPRCWRPSLANFILYHIDLRGFFPLATCVRCTDCREWVTTPERTT